MFLMVTLYGVIHPQKVTSTILHINTNFDLYVQQLATKSKVVPIVYASKINWKGTSLALQTLQ